jgi:hypothetical protein
MKRRSKVRLLAGSIVLAAGAAAPEAQAQPGMLGREMFVQMDADRDSRVSKREYVEYGTAYLKKTGKRINRSQVEKRFLNFDHDGDGFISGSEAQGCAAGKAGQDGMHRGRLAAKAAVKKTSERTVGREVKNRRGGTQVTVTTKRIQEEAQSLTISVSNSGTGRDTFELCWYFFCRSHDGSEVRVYDEGAREITLDPRKCTTCTVVSGRVSLVKESVQKENPDTGVSSNPAETVWGDRAEGYLVLLKHNDVILDKESSSKEFLAEPWLGRL